jgi:hypothetical protein
MFIDGHAIQSGDPSPPAVAPNPVLVAEIESENGLNTIGATGRNMLIYVAGTNQIITATSGFEYDLDCHQNGTLTWRLDGLPSGLQNIHLVVYDSFNNISVAGATFIIAETVPIRIQNALVYPSPMRGAGHFTFDLSHNADVVINIYTITGRRVRSIRQNGLSNGFNQIAWDGRDADGHRLANNTYFYTIRANSTVGRGSSEVTERFMVLR